MCPCNHCCSGKAISITYSECVCSLRYPACNAHVPYCHVACQARQHFSTLSHKRQDFRKKKVIEHKMHILIFPTTFVWNTLHSKKNWAIYDEKCVSVFMYGTHYCLILLKLEFSWRSFEKYSNIKFHENLSSGSRGVPRGHMYVTKLKTKSV